MMFFSNDFSGCKDSQNTPYMEVTSCKIKRDETLTLKQLLFVGYYKPTNSST